MVWVGKAKPPEIIFARAVHATLAIRFIASKKFRNALVFRRAHPKGHRTATAASIFCWRSTATGVFNTSSVDDTSHLRGSATRLVKRALREGQATIFTSKTSPVRFAKHRPAHSFMDCRQHQFQSHSRSPLRGDRLDFVDDVQSLPFSLNAGTCVRVN